MNMVVPVSEHVVENKKFLRSNIEKVVEIEKLLHKKKQVVENFFLTCNICDSLIVYLFTFGSNRQENQYLKPKN